MLCSVWPFYVYCLRFIFRSGCTYCMGSRQLLFFCLLFQLEFLAVVIHKHCINKMLFFCISSNSTHYDAYLKLNHFLFSLVTVCLDGKRIFFYSFECGARKLKESIDE